MNGREEGRKNTIQNSDRETVGRWRQTARLGNQTTHRKWEHPVRRGRGQGGERQCNCLLRNFS